MNFINKFLNIVDSKQTIITMKVVHVIDSIDQKAGGTSAYVQILTNELVKRIQIAISTIKSDSPLSFDPNIEIDESEVNFSISQIFSSQLGKNLIKLKPDLLHGNGLWGYPVHGMASFAKKLKIPYIISPHGMLEPWALNTKKWKKKLALLLYQYNDLAKASCIHATAQSEAENIRKLGFKNPIAVIPNGIKIAEFPIRQIQSEPEKKTLLFLSRIHPKKGIELLIDAWFNSDKKLRKNWHVEIAGNGDKMYIESLQKRIDEKGLSTEIRIIGPQFGRDKLLTYHRADLFVLPTYSENFGIVLVEAMACGIPVITTKGTPWEEVNKLNAGYWIEIGVPHLTDALNKIFKLTFEQLLQMGENGCRLVNEKYSIESVAFKTIKLYSWVLGKSEMPDFVRLD